MPDNAITVAARAADSSGNTGALSSTASVALLNDNPPGDYDPTYWWPEAAGYDRSVERMTYTPVETWQVLSGALQKVGMSAAEAAAVMGDNMLRVAGLAWQRACP